MAETSQIWFPCWALVLASILQGTSCQNIPQQQQNNLGQRLQQQQQKLQQLQQQHQQLQQQQQHQQPLASNNNPVGVGQNVYRPNAGMQNILQQQQQQQQQMYKHVGKDSAQLPIAQKAVQQGAAQGQGAVGAMPRQPTQAPANYANNPVNNVLKDNSVVNNLGNNNNNNIKVSNNDAGLDTVVKHDNQNNNLNNDNYNHNKDGFFPNKKDIIPAVENHGANANTMAPQLETGVGQEESDIQAIQVKDRVKDTAKDPSAGLDIANVPKNNQDSNNVKPGESNNLPVNTNVIYGDKEKDVKPDNEAVEGDEDDEEEEDEDFEDEESPLDDAPLDNEPADNNFIPNNNVDQAQPFPPQVGHAGNAPMPNPQKPEEPEKPGSLKVVWDWSDFAVNFEQYVMPEQKIRRAPHSTTGEPWPLPQYYVSKKDKVYEIDRQNFRFKLSKIRCDVIEKALERYKPYVLEDTVEDMYDNFQHAQSTMFDDPSLKYETPTYLEAPLVSMVNIKIRKPCARYPTTKMDETYDLFVKRTGIHIWANEVWGALRGLETFSQLVHKGTNQKLYIRDTVINDYPRFSHRGIMVDSSRHFMFKETIYDILEGMSQNKMNVMHWHLVDDQSFPFYSQAYPDLSAKGAFHPTFVYMPEDIADIIEFARLRGIRVEPEFDTPGHTYSWGLSRPDLLTQCYQGDRPVDGYVGPMDPSKNETFRFLKNFFKDVMHVFKDEFIHLGGDETPMTCWQSNPEVMKFLAKLEGRGDTGQLSNDPYHYSYDIRKVLEYYVNRLITDLKSLAGKRTNGARFVFWQEIMNNNVQLPNDTIIHVWQGGMEDVQRATSLGLNVIYSTCWYLDLIEYGTKWSKYYQCDPADTAYGFSIDETKVLGGEAALWAEYIDNENAMTTLWPRASAAAERLWSSKDVKDLDSAAARLQEHRCRMLSRGLGVGQISGPDYCLRRGRRRHQFNETTNCTHCGNYNEQSRFEVENIKVEFEQKGGRMLDCSQAVIHAGSQMTIFLVLFIIIAIIITIKFTKQKIVHIRMCKNKSILMVFITLILLYFFCYVTSIWMQAMEFKGSFEKRVSSNLQQH